MNRGLQQGGEVSCRRWRYSMTTDRNRRSGLRPAGGPAVGGRPGGEKLLDEATRILEQLAHQGQTLCMYRMGFVEVLGTEPPRRDVTRARNSAAKIDANWVGRLPLPARAGALSGVGRTAHPRRGGGHGFTGKLGWGNHAGRIRRGCDCPEHSRSGFPPIRVGCRFVRISCHLVTRGCFRLDHGAGAPVGTDRWADRKCPYGAPGGRALPTESL